MSAPTASCVRCGTSTYALPVGGANSPAIAAFGFGVPFGSGAPSEAAVTPKADATLATVSALPVEYVNGGSAIFASGINRFCCCWIVASLARSEACTFVPSSAVKRAAKLTSVSPPSTSSVAPP